MTDEGQALSKDKQRTVVDEARERIQQSWENDRDNRREAATDLSFLAGNQWPDDIRRLRTEQKRMTLTFNRLPQFVRQVTNDIRQADIALKAIPTDDKSDKELARVYDGIMRDIQYQSSAKHVFSTAAEHQSACGIGWFRIDTQFGEDSFDQDIRIKSIRNPLSVYDDPGAVESDRSDAMWRAVVEVWPLATFKEQYPKASTEGMERPSDDSTMSLSWSTTDTVRIAEYWRKVPKKRTLALLPTGATIDATDLDAQSLREMQPVRLRKVDGHAIEQYLLSGSEVLSGPNVWPGRYIPIVPVIGGEFPLEDKTYRYGVIRFARDSQSLYNFYRTANAEVIAAQPKAPYLVTSKMIGPHKGMWYSANAANLPFLLYEPDPGAAGGPKREPPPQFSPAMAQEAAIASDDMKATTGIYDAALGAKSNETSGVAIARRQLEADVANYHFADNLLRSLEYVGRVLIDLIPKIYDSERIVRLLGQDGSEEFRPINQRAVGPDGTQTIINDLSTGKFDIRVKLDKGHTSKRIEAAESMLAYLQTDPAAAPMVRDLIAKNLDWPGADEIAKRFKNSIPPNLLFDPEAPPDQQQPQQGPPPDPAQQAATELAQRGMQAKVSLDEANAAKAQAEAHMVMAGGQEAQRQPAQQEPVFDAKAHVAQASIPVELRMKEVALETAEANRETAQANRDIAIEKLQQMRVEMAMKIAGAESPSRETA